MVLRSLLPLIKAVLGIAPVSISATVPGLYPPGVAIPSMPCVSATTGQGNGAMSSS